MEILEKYIFCNYLQIKIFFMVDDDINGQIVGMPISLSALVGLGFGFYGVDLCVYL